MTNQQLWWLTDTYNVEEPVPDVFRQLAGPKGLALVKAWPSGQTDEGWGLVGRDGGPGFMPRYLKGEFTERRVLHGYALDRWAFAFVMRSLDLVCIDIDGKNGGFDHVSKLGRLPATLAETSKSGDGFHLFYSVGETWHPDKGFGSMSDRIGIEQGVDVRATGCVYHHKQQRWNHRPIAELPLQLYEALVHREQKIQAQNSAIKKVLESNDDMEVLMMHDQILSDLAKPIPSGKRNNTLFAIGSQMQQAQVPNWEDLLKDRATQVGLPDEESDKIVANINRYAGTP